MIHDIKEKLGIWAFMVGIVIAVIISLVAAFSGNGSLPAWAQWTPLALAILGIIVGLMNVTGAETHHYLLASVAFLISVTSLSLITSAFATGAVLGGIATSISLFFTLMVAFVAPSTAIVAVLALFHIARD